MTKEERQKLYLALCAPFPAEAIERTDARLTGKGYSTTGVKYQYVADRLSEVLGVGGFRAERSITVRETQTSKGRQAFEAICEIKLQLGEWIDGVFQPFAEALGDGGHTAMSEADARKGAYTNAFKKAAAFLGPGREAYRGTIDDDHVPAETGPDRYDQRPARPAPQPAPQERPPAPPRVAPTAETSRPLTPQTSQAATAPPERTRLTSKQLGAILAISRKLGMEQRGLRTYVRETFGCQPEYLSRDQASQLISTLSATGPGSGNGAGHLGHDVEG